MTSACFKKSLMSEQICKVKLWYMKCFIFQSRFLKAMKMVGDEFLDRVTYYKRAWLPARELVEKAVNNRKQVWSTGYNIYVYRQRPTTRGHGCRRGYIK